MGILMLSNRCVGLRFADGVCQLSCFCTVSHGLYNLIRVRVRCVNFNIRKSIKLVCCLFVLCVCVGC